MTDHARLRALDDVRPMTDVEVRLFKDVVALRAERDDTARKLSEMQAVARVFEAERDALAALLREARDTIDRRFGPLGSNNIDAPLLDRIDAALGAE